MTGRGSAVGGVCSEVGVVCSEVGGVGGGRGACLRWKEVEVGLVFEGVW